MALNADSPRVYELGEINELPVAATTKVYEGSALGDNGSGYVRPLVAGDPFRGFAQRQSDNSTGAAGDKTVRIGTERMVVLNVSGAAITDVGKAVYASDDDTFTYTATGNSYVGRVYRWVSSGVVVVEYDGNKADLGSFTPLTDNSGGTASDTLAAITDGPTKNAIASLAAKVNILAGMLK